MKNNLNQPRHRYMIVAIASFLDKEGKPGVKYLNVVAESRTKQINLGQIKQAQDACMMQIVHFGVDPEGVKDITIVNVCYMGHMTDSDFVAGLPQAQQEAMEMTEQSDSISEMPNRYEN